MEAQPPFNGQLYRQLFANLPDTALVVFDHDLRHVMAEGAALEELGFSGAAITGKTLWDVLPAETAEVLETLYRAALRGETQTEEGCYANRDLQLTAAPMKDDNDAITGGMLIIQDVTRFRESEAQRIEHELRYHQLFTHTNDAVFIIDLEGRHIEVNQRAADMMGYQPDEMIGLTFREMVAEGEVNQSEQVLARLKAGEKMSVYERTFVRKDGTVVHTEVDVALVAADDGTPLYIQSVIRDITNRKRVEQKLLESEQRYRAVTELISDFAYSYRVHEDHTVELEWVTEDSFHRMTGFTSREIIERGRFSLWHPEDHQQIREISQRVMAGETVVDEHRLITRDGQVRWMRVHRRPVWDEQQGRVVRFYGIAQDITDRVLAEETLRESERRYRIISELISDYAYAYTVDENGQTMLEWITGDSFTRITGYTTDDLREGRVRDHSMFHPEDQVISRQHQIDVLHYGRSFSADYRLITKIGEMRWVRYSRHPVWDVEQNRVVRVYGVAQDITDQKLAEIAVRRHERLLNQSQRIANIGGWELDLIANKLTWTAQTCIIHEVPLDYEPDVETAINFYAPEVRALLAEAVEQALQGHPYDLELPLITATGRHIWVRTIGEAEFVDGEVVRIFGTFQDITERRQAEMTLRENEERYRMITELIYDYAFSSRVIEDPKTGEKTTETEWITEEPFERITGFTYAETRERSVVHPDDLPHLRRDVHTAIEGEPNTSEFRIITKSGEVRWLRINRYPEWDADSTHVVRYYGVAQDITEQKLAEEALRASEERFRLIAQTANDGLYDYNIASNIYWFSEGYIRLLGTKDLPDVPLDKIMKWWRRRVHPDDLADIIQRQDRLAEGKLPRWELEYRFRRDDGRYVVLSDRGYALINDQGVLERVFGAVTDITQRREAERRALDLAVERERMQIFTDFTTAISHDFRTPLSVINTSLYLLERAKDPASEQQQIAKIKQQAVHIEGLVDGLLTMSQLDRPNALSFDTLDVNTLLRYLHTREYTRFAAAEITLTMQLAAELPPVRADHTWLYRSLLNLMDNARLYTPSGGQVTVRSLVENGQVVVQVVDTGIGIDSEHMRYIFEPLYRVAGHRPTSGQGLGLSIARKIVERHGGHIMVSSTPGQGSTFSIFLPAIITEGVAG